MQLKAWITSDRNGDFCRCVATLLQVIQILDESPNISIDENYTGGDTDGVTEPAEDTPITLWGNVAAFVERLDDELFKSLQVTAPPVGPHTGRFSLHSLN